MPVPDRSLVRRRVALGAALGLIAFIGVVVLADAVLDPGEPTRPAPPAQDVTSPGDLIETPPLPLPPPPVGRGEVIAAVQRAASAHAAGQPAPETNAELVGRTFLVKIPFGCEGPRTAASPAAVAYWEHDEQRGAVRLRAQPQVWTQAAWVRELAAPAKFDAVEGFWVPRPWTSAETCPPPRKAAAPAAEKTKAPAEKAKAANEKAPDEKAKTGEAPAVRQTLGLAMFFEPGSSRVVQRGSRPYEFVRKVSADQPPAAPKGYRLVLAGRIVGFDGDQPVRCRADDPYERPVCLVAVAFDQVAFEDGATGETLAEWRMN